MTDTTSMRARLGRSDQPVVTGWRLWLQLWWVARGDRRAGLPLGLSSESTPILRQLAAWHDELCEQERGWYLAEIKPLLIRLSSIEAALPSLRGDVEACRAEVERLEGPIPEEKLRVRRLGEERFPENFTRQRREQEHRRALDAARAALDEAERALKAAVDDEAKYLSVCRNHRDGVRARIAEHADRVNHTAAAYRRFLVWRHRQREQLIDEWQPDICPPPAWAVEDDQLPPFSNSGVSA